MPNSKLYVVLHDIHYPKTNFPTFNVALEFIKQNEIAGVTLGGDQLDFECISHHTKGMGLYRPPGAYQRDIEGFDEKILTPLEKAAGDVEKVWHIGNHERFEHDFIEHNPELQGTVDHVELLDLHERGWKVVPLGHCSKIGKLNVIHGEILTGIGNQAGVFPSRKAVDLYGANVLAGHTHSPQSFAKISPVESTQKHMGWIAPCVCDVNPGYLRNRPTAWLNGFTIVELGEKGLFNVYPIIVHDGQFCFGGKIYKAKK